MANTHLVHLDRAIDKFSGTDPDQDAESFIQLIERKINFAPGDAPGDAGELANYTFRKKALFSSLLRGPAAEWYENNITNSTSWEKIRTKFIIRFSDGRSKFWYRMEVEHCIRGDGVAIRNFLHRIERTVDKGWPDDMNGFEATQQNAVRGAQGWQRGQRCIDYPLKRLRPGYLQRKAQKYLMENPITTWNDFSTQLTQRDVPFQVSSNFSNDEGQTISQMATLGQEMRNLESEVQEHRVNAVEGSPRTVDPNQKRGRNATRLWNYCRTNGHTPSWCRKKIRDEELKRIENKRIAEKKVTFTQDYNKKQGPDYGSKQWTRGQIFPRRKKITTLMVLKDVFPHLIKFFSKTKLRRWKQPSEQRKILWSTPKSAIQEKRWNSIPKWFFRLSEWELAKQSKLLSFSINSQERFLTNISYRQPGSDQLNNFAFRRPDNQPPTGLTPYEQNFPQNNNQTPPNTVRFTTTDETHNDLLDLCPLNY